MDNGSYLMILVIGALIVFAMGQLLMRKAPAYLDEAYEDLAQSRKVAGLVIGFFHLIMLGLVFLTSSLGLSPEAGTQSVLARIGVIFLLTAVGYGITLLVLSRMRDQEQATQVELHTTYERDRVLDDDR
ncbi:MAG: hypothetical protein ACT4O0_02645 [Pseudonocardia sp.]|jgi:Kef-type K+ transport system membrane component KefB